jgi:predicted transcriptional regulator
MTTTKNMENEIFESLGLSPNEAKMYLSLIEKGESSVSEIALAAGIHRRNAYDAIQRLVDKGLCFQIVSPGENKYNAVDPDKLTELLGEKQEKLATILPELRKKFEHRVASEEIYIYRGLEGQKNIWRDILRVGKDSYFIGAKGGWQDDRLSTARSAFFREANRKKIVFRGLYDHEMKSRLDLLRGFGGKGEFRFLPEGYSALNSGIQVFGDYVVTYAGLMLGKMSNKAVFFVIRSADLADGYRAWFKYMWDRSAPVDRVQLEKSYRHED